VKAHQSRFFFITISIFISLSLMCSTALGTDFIRVDKTHFMRGDKPYYFCGANFWYGCYLGAENQGRLRLFKELDRMKSLGITNLRVLGASEESAIERSVSPQYNLHQENSMNPY